MKPLDDPGLQNALRAISDFDQQQPKSTQKTLSSDVEKKLLNLNKKHLSSLEVLLDVCRVFETLINVNLCRPDAIR